MTESRRSWLAVAGAAERASLSRDTIYTACERSELGQRPVGGRLEQARSRNRVRVRTQVGERSLGRS